MSVDLTTVIISISAAVLSGFGARLMSSFSEKKREVVRRQYYDAIKQLIEVRVELEETLIKLSIIHIKHEHDYQED